MPAKIPSIKTQQRAAKKFLTKDMDVRATPTDIAEITMVLLWLMREDICPEPSRDIKYPIDRNKKSEPASLWLSAKSFSKVGSNGANMIREEKFKKKMDARRKRGVRWFRKVSSGTESLKWVVVVPASFKISIPCLMIAQIQSLGKLWMHDGIVKSNSEVLTGCRQDENYFSLALEHLEKLIVRLYRMANRFAGQKKFF